MRWGGEEFANQAFKSNGLCSKDPPDHVLADTIHLF